MLTESFGYFNPGLFELLEVHFPILLGYLPEGHFRILAII
jgi:hypothetical protein